MSKGDFASEWLTFHDLGERWRVHHRTIEKLVNRGILPGVELPGRRGRFIKLQDVLATEDAYRNGGSRPVPTTADTILADRDRCELAWHEFRNQVSPADPLQSDLERAVAEKLASDPKFVADGVEDFIAGKRAEYDAVISHVAKKQRESGASPELKRMFARTAQQSQTATGAPEMRKLVEGGK